MQQDSHLDLSARSSRHQLSNLPQINATSQVHLPGVDLQNVQTGLFTQMETCSDQVKQKQAGVNATKDVPPHLEGETRSSGRSGLV